MESALLKICVHPQAGTFDLDDQSFYLRQATSRLTYVENGKKKSLDLIHGGALKTFSTLQNGSRCVHVEVSQTKGAIATTLSFRKVESDPFVEISARIDLVDDKQQVRVESIELFRAPFAQTFLAAGDISRCRFWGDWHDIWHEVGSRPLAGESVASDIEKSCAYHAASLYEIDSRRAITCLYRLPNQWLDLLAHEEGSLVARNRIGVTLRRHQPLYSDRVQITLGLPFTEALPRLHKSHQSRRRVTESRNHFGWNSWEAYHGKVTEADILENVQGINLLPWMKNKIQYITVDDGWSRCYGDWVPNEKFPSGMDDLAQKITESGFLPGIWSAPFLVDKKSELCATHSDWFLKTKEGFYHEPIGQRFVLDSTHPEVHSHIYGLYRQFYSWGYRYYKTDFLRDAMMMCIPERKEYCPDIQLHDPELGIARGMRCCMEAIRAGVGEDSFWLGCGTDIGSGAGLMDGSRTGGDVVSFWTRVPYQARSVINHFHLHGNLFLVDPDFCLVRGSETFDLNYLDVPLVSEKPYVVDEFEGGACFTAEDARAWSTLVLLSGGLLNVSDRIKALNKMGLSILQTAMTYAGGAAAVPVDIENSIPHVLLAEREEYYLLGIVNWNHEKPITVTLDAKSGVPFPADGCMKEVWTGAEVKLTTRHHQVKLQPHQVRLYTWPK